MNCQAWLCGFGSTGFYGARVTGEPTTCEQFIDGLPVLDAIELPMPEAQACVLAAPAVCQSPVPAFATVAVQGMAVRSQDCIAGKTLKIVDDVPAGFLASQPLTAGQAIRVMAGAPVPPGADAVVSRDRVHVVGDSVQAPVVRAGTGIVQIGEVLAAGAIVARAGEDLDPVHIGVLARAGVRSVLVHPRPRLVVVTCGTEFVEPGTATPIGLVADHLSFLAVALGQAGGALSARVPPVFDDADALALVVDDNVHRSDLVIVCGIGPPDMQVAARALGIRVYPDGLGGQVALGVRAGIPVLCCGDTPEAVTAQWAICQSVINALSGRRAALD